MCHCPLAICMHMYSVLSCHDQSVRSQLKSNHVFPWLDLRLTDNPGRRFSCYNFPRCLRNSLQQMLSFKLQLFPATACSNSSLIAAIQLKLPSGQRPSAPVRSPVYNKVIQPHEPSLIIPSSRIHHRTLQSPIEPYGGHSTQGTEARVDEAQSNDGCSNAQPWKSLVTEHQLKF